MALRPPAHRDHTVVFHRGADRAGIRATLWATRPTHVCPYRGLMFDCLGPPKQARSASNIAGEGEVLCQASNTPPCRDSRHRRKPRVPVPKSRVISLSSTFADRDCTLWRLKSDIACGFRSSPSGKLAGADAAAPRDVHWRAAHEGIMPSEEDWGASAEGMTILPLRQRNSEFAPCRLHTAS